MEDEFVIVPSNGTGYEAVEDTLELSRTKPMGKLFKKHILNKGPLIHPVSKRRINIDDEFIRKLQTNFHDGVCDIVQVPLANDANQHSEDPLRNIGEVVDIQQEGDKVYAMIDVRDEDAAKKMGKTLLGASALMSLNYTDTRTGKPAGPTLLHACVTNRPYVVGLDNYEEIVAATADNTSSVVLLSADPVTAETTEETEMPKTLDELLAQLKEEHGIDVRALQASTSEKEAELEQATALSNTLSEEVTKAKHDAEHAQETVQKLTEELSGAGVIKLTNGEELSQEDIVGAVAEIAQNHLALSNQVKELREKDAKAEVQKLVDDGFLYPSQLKGMTTLKLTNEELFTSLIPAKPVVELEKESGVLPEETTHELNLEDQLAALTAENPQFFGNK